MNALTLVDGNRRIRRAQILTLQWRSNLQNVLCEGFWEYFNSISRPAINERQYRCVMVELVRLDLPHTEAGYLSSLFHFILQVDPWAYASITLDFDS